MPGGSSQYLQAVPLVDVVVVSYNNADHLRTCVETLGGCDDMNVIVVDSASQDHTLDTVRDLPIDVAALGENRGFGYACNVGWRRGKSPYVLFLNPDATIDAAAVRVLAEAASIDGIGATAPRIVGPGGELEYSLRRFPRLRTTYAQAMFLHRVFPKAPWTDELIRSGTAYEEPSSPDWVSGACVLVRRDALERVGGFDEGFFLYCEDIDLCRRLRDRGFDIRFVPESLAVHEGGASAPRAALLPVLAASRVRYARLHRSRAYALLERLGVALGALSHAVVSRGGKATRTGHMRALLRAVSPSAHAN